MKASRTQGITCRRQRQQGIAAIEFVGVLPVLGLIIAFTMFFGRMFWQYTVVLKAAHDTATFVAMARPAELTIHNADRSELDVIKVARAIAEEEMAELNPGDGTKPVTHISCDGEPCAGLSTPAEILVVVHTSMVDSFLVNMTRELTGLDEFWIEAEVRVPYVGN